MRKLKDPTWKPMKTVYSFVFPETFQTLHSIESIIDIELFRTETSAARAQEILQPHFPGLIVPATASGAIDLDEMHRPIMDRVVGAYARQVPGLNGFRNMYPTSGSSEGLFHLLTSFKLRGVKEINVLAGEYEGYKEQGKNVGLETRVWEEDDAGILRLPHGSVWFISNPCARDGNIVSNAFIERLARLGHQIVLDIAYVGATKPHVFDVDFENVVAVVMSFSKPYGTFRFRIGGFVFSREPMPSLYGNKWFKDVQRLFQALALAERIGPEGLYPKYRPVQEGIINALNTKFGLGLVPSDSLLLANLSVSRTAHLDAEQKALIASFLREDNYRFCLTPYFEQVVPVTRKEFPKFGAQPKRRSRKS